MLNIYVQQFSNLLRETCYNNVEVLSAGFSGYDAQFQFKNIKKNEALMKKIEPNLIIIEYVTNCLKFRNENFLYNKIFNYND